MTWLYLGLAIESLCSEQHNKTTEALNKLSCLGILSMIEIEDSVFTKDVYDKRDGFGFHVVNVPNLRSNIPLSPAY